MAAVKKKRAKVKNKKFVRRGSTGTSILYMVVLFGALAIGVLFAGSGLPQQTFRPEEKAIVTLIPKDDAKDRPAMQMQTFTGVTGLPTATPTLKPTPTIPITDTGGATTCASASTPSAPITGYHLTKCEDFSGPGTGAFGGYDGGGDGTVVGGGRKTAQCTVSGGSLILTQNADGSTCGGSMSSFNQKYGYWEVRMRSYTTGGSGSAPHPVLILWPDTDKWPDGELDYFESDIGDNAVGVYLHCVGNPSSNCYHTTENVDMAQWHVYGFEWTAAGFVGYVDGKQFYTTSGNGSNPNVSMHQTIQLDNLSGNTPVKSGKMEVDWVHMYSK